MKKIISILSIGLILFSCDEQKNIEVGNKTSFSIQPVYNAGKAILGEEIKAAFTVKNTGDYPLIISQVNGSCSCTVAEYPEEPIAPGESGKIKATVKTENASPGELSKEVRIVANTDPSLTTVLIKANVIRRK
jgi:uncharacterized membrane protein